MGGYFSTPEELWASIGRADAPVPLDVRRAAVRAADDRTIPGARWRDPADAADWAIRSAKSHRIVVYCAHAHQLSQMAAAEMRRTGIDASVLDGGLEAWCQAGLPVVHRRGLVDLGPEGTGLWVTRRRPKVDRIACAWLILRFIDPDARFLFVEPDQVIAAARELGGTPFDVEGVSYTHVGACCSFDILLERSGLADRALSELAIIIRGADTDRLDVAREAAGLLAASLGNSALAGDNDQQALLSGLPLYDALYAWRRHASAETHKWPAAVSP